MSATERKNTIEHGAIDILTVTKADKDTEYYFGYGECIITQFRPTPTCGAKVGFIYGFLYPLRARTIYTLLIPPTLLTVVVMTLLIFWDNISNKLCKLVVE